MFERYGPNRIKTFTVDKCVYTPHKIIRVFYQNFEFFIGFCPHLGENGRFLLNLDKRCVSNICVIIFVRVLTFAINIVYLRL